VLSQIARATFPAGSSGSTFYYLVQAFTLAILILAANSSYQGFPRLAALLARDRFFPRQFVNLGDRLVYSNGIVLVAALASALIVIFSANVESLQFVAVPAPEQLTGSLTRPCERLLLSAPRAKPTV